MPTTSFHTVSPLASQNRDPNRKSHTDSGSRARLHRTTDYDSSTGTPEYRQLISADDNSHRRVRTGSFHEPNRESFADTPFNPGQTIQRQATDMATAAIPQETDNLPVRQPSDNPDNGSNLESHADSQSSPHDTTSRQVTVPDNHPRTAGYQHSTSTLDSSRHTDNHDATRIRGPNRKSHTDSESSARPRRPAPDHVQRQHHETAEYQQPTSAADISHPATNHVTARAADRIGNRTPIPDPVRTTPPANRPPPTTATQKPQNANNPSALGRQSTDTPAIRQPAPTDQIGNHILISGPVRTRPIPPATETPAVGNYLLPGVD
jgi:hypothetical protein